MSNLIPAKRKLFDKGLKYMPVSKPVKTTLRKANIGLDIGKGLSGIANPKMPQIPETPAAPTIDDAQRNRSQQDRLRRRRGVLANIYGGGASTLG